MFSVSTYRPEIKFHINEEEKVDSACEMSVYEEREQEAPVDTQRAASPGISFVSMRSNNSMYVIPPDLSDGAVVTSDPV
ncbi:hypothetical protein M9458_054777, partial [Cirrhinus mrigala]